MSDKKTHSKKHRLIWVSIIPFLILLLLVAGAYCMLFGWNHFSLEIELVGEPAVSVEYGDDFRDPGAIVCLRGTRFWTNGIPLDIAAETQSTLNMGKTGKYSIEYIAHFIGMDASNTRIVRVVDTQCPIITLVPDPDGLEPQPEYQEAGFSAFDNYDGDITDRVHRFVEDDRIIYSVIDSSGNPTEITRPIPLYDSYPPDIELIGGPELIIPLGTRYEEPGYRAVDRKDGDLTSQVTVFSECEISRYIPGTYTLTYQVTDSDGYEASVNRVISVEPCAAPELIWPKGKTIYLTFDDGPGPDTVRLLNVLKQYGIRATFFVTDTGYPDLMRRIVAEGHSIGVHTRTHRYTDIYSSIDAYFADAFDMQQIILDATGTETWLLRFPGGSSNTISRKYPGIMTTLTQAVEAAGFSYFDWNVDSDDAGHATTTGAVYRNVVDAVSQNQVSIVLQHDIHGWSVDAVEQIIQWGLNNGYQFLPLQTDSPNMHHTVLN